MIISSKQREIPEKPRENLEKPQKTLKKSKEYIYIRKHHIDKNRELSLENTASPLLMQILESFEFSLLIE